jgi:hypothetical protein
VGLSRRCEREHLAVCGLQLRLQIPAAAGEFQVLVLESLDQVGFLLLSFADHLEGAHQGCVVNLDIFLDILDILSIFLVGIV